MSNAEPSSQSVFKKCGQLTAVTAAAWLAMAGPAHYLAGTTGLEGLSYAAVLCLVPGWIVFLISARFQKSYAQAAMVFLAGSTLRLLIVLVGMLVIRTARPDLGFREFVVWLLAFYLTTLLTETLMVLKQKPASEPPLGDNGLKPSNKVN